jgi:hypothetical protein
MPVDGDTCGRGNCKSSNVPQEHNQSSPGLIQIAKQILRDRAPARAAKQLDSIDWSHQAASMRTTVTLEPDLAKKVKLLAHRRGLSFKQALNEVIRRGLAPAARRDEQAKYVVQPHAGGFRPGIDPDKLNQLVDQLEVEDFAAEVKR